MINFRKRKSWHEFPIIPWVVLVDQIMTLLTEKHQINSLHLAVTNSQMSTQPSDVLITTKFRADN